ncbi:HNH endonuclease [Paenibacillus tianjinensis]|uniref:HNH endonuclease n=1 Tax=Paenibacillus tianjinensis TaxID=2810347 RepID=A0ABX7LBJ1_9BACL|nr:HNH endonuclease [Paenibacillus tianjinensis]QSF43352.1 HNH endonuclease [Paenibacillus tianjinensis]
MTDTIRSRRRDNRICDICNDDKEIRQCGVEGEFKGRLLCLKHYTQVRLYGLITDINKSHMDRERICEVCGAEEAIYYRSSNQMLCRRHYDHMWNFGKILKRTINDPNEVIKFDTYAEIIMYNSKNEETSRAIVDLEDVDLLSRHKWRENNWGYPSTGNGRSEINCMMHQLLMHPKDGEIVDHINRNPLDNRRCNLRIVNKSINSINTGLRGNNVSGVTGVTYNKNAKSWRAFINFNGTRIELGHKKLFEDAVRKRLRAEIYYYPDYPPQAHLFEKYGVNYKNE